MSRTCNLAGLRWAPRATLGINLPSRLSASPAVTLFPIEFTRTLWETKPIDGDFSQDGVGLVRLENESLCVDVAPSVGGRIVSLFCKREQREVLWRNIAQPLVRENLGSSFDPVFYGGIDELLPNASPEFFDGVDYPCKAPNPPCA